MIGLAGSGKGLLTGGGSPIRALAMDPKSKGLSTGLSSGRVGVVGPCGVVGELGIKDLRDWKVVVDGEFAQAVAYPDHCVDEFHREGLVLGEVVVVLVLADAFEGLAQLGMHQGEHFTLIPLEALPRHWVMPPDGVEHVDVDTQGFEGPSRDDHGSAIVRALDWFVHLYLRLSSQYVTPSIVTNNPGRARRCRIIW